MSSILNQFSPTRVSFPQIGMQDLRKQAYEMGLLNNCLVLNDDEHESFIKENIDYFKQLDRSFISKVFFTAVERDHIKTVKILLQEKCNDINALDASNNTALMLASKFGYFEMVKYLIDNRADLDITYSDRQGALTIAILEKKNEIALELIERGANIEIKDSFGLTPLMNGAWVGLKDVVLKLIEKKVDKEGHDKNGMTALMCAAVGGRDDIVSILCDKGTKKDVRNEVGQTAMMVAANGGYRKVVSVLCDKGADKDVQTKKGFTALMYAALKGHKLTFSVLLENGADKDLQDKIGRSALTMLSLAEYRIEIIDQLARSDSIIIPFDNGSISSISAYANKLLKRLLEVDKEKKEQSSDSNILKLPKVLVLFPLEDWNGSFSIHKRIGIVKTLEKYYNKVKFKHPTSFEQIKELLEKNECNLLYLAGHGSPKQMTFTRNLILKIEDVKKLNPIKGAQIVTTVFHSCSTGEIGGIAECFAKKMRSKTFAPKESTNYLEIKFKNNELQVNFFNIGGDTSHFFENPLGALRKDVTRIIDFGSNDKKRVQSTYNLRRKRKLGVF